MFVHFVDFFDARRKHAVREHTMTATALNPEQQLEAKELEAKIRLAIEKEVGALAALLAAKGERDLFGQTEFEVRDLVLRIGAKAYEERLRQKKRLRRVGSRLSDLWAIGRISGVASAQAAQHFGTAHSAPRVLLLPSLRRCVSLG